MPFRSSIAHWRVLTFAGLGSSGWSLQPHKMGVGELSEVARSKSASVPLGLLLLRSLNAFKLRRVFYLLTRDV